MAEGALAHSSSPRRFGWGDARAPAWSEPEVNVRSSGLMRWMTVWVAMATVGVPVEDAAAREGAIEINAARAAAGDVTGTGADGAGYPVTLDVPGTYLLTSNLEPTASDGIDVTADDVMIDLNGFTINGPTACSGTPGAISCGAGSGLGIDGTGVSVEVRNGRVTGFASGGVRLGDESRVEGVKAFLNGGPGIEVGVRSLVRDNQAVRNAGNGIVAGDDCIVSWNSTSGNTLLGLVLGSSAGFSQNVSNDNGGGGFSGGLAVGSNACEDSLDCSETTELCDGLDNDGDASVDEDWPTLGDACSSNIGACTSGVIVCSGDALDTECSGVEPTTEICNSVDDDCDGMTDEDFNFGSDVNNCGSCGNQCAAGEACTAGACVPL